MEPSAFRVLVCVLDYANADGEDAYASVDRLARDCCMSRSTVKRRLADLVKDGWLRKGDRGGRRGDGRVFATVYALSTPPSMAHARSVEKAISMAHQWSIEKSQGVKSDASAAHRCTLNGSPVHAQGLTGDPPSDPLTNPLSGPDHREPNLEPCEGCGTLIQEGGMYVSDGRLLCTWCQVEKNARRREERED